MHSADVMLLVCCSNAGNANLVSLKASSLTWMKDNCMDSTTIRFCCFFPEYKTIVFTS